MRFYTEPLDEDLMQKRKYQPSVRDDILPTAGLRGDRKGQVIQVWEYGGKAAHLSGQGKGPKDRSLSIFARSFASRQRKANLANMQKWFY